MAVVDARPLGATPPPVAHHGAALQPVVAHQVGVEAVAKLLAGAVVVGAQLMVAVTTVTGLLTAVTVHGHPMAGVLRTEELLHMVEAHLMAEMTAHALHTVASTQATARLLGVAHPAMPRNHRAASPLLHLAHTTRRHLVLMRLPLPVLMVLTRLQPQAALWMLQHLESSLLLPREIPDTSTAKRLRLHQRQGLGNRLHLRRVETQDIIESVI
jgi:hypothetical protein